MSVVDEVTPTEAATLVAENDNVVLVDVRHPIEWQLVGRPETRGGLFVEWTTSPDGTPAADFADRVRAAAGDRAESIERWLFLCRSGQRSLAAAQVCAAAGFGHCTNVADGFEGPLDEHGHRGVRGWKAEGLEWWQQ